jgi:hypothetical protein
MSLAEDQAQEKKEWSVVKLVAFWQKYSALFSFIPQRNPSPKEVGQIKKLRERTGDETVHLMAWALDNWCQFTSQVQAIEKLTQIPANPNIGFLLKYWLIAAALLHLSAPSKIAKTMARLEHESSMAS